MRSLTALAFTLALSLSAVADEKTVRAVEFEGLHLHSRDEVLAHMQTREGRPWSPSVMDDDILRLEKTGWFVDPKYAVTRTPEGVIVRVTLFENDVLKRITIVGNRRFSDEELLTDAHLKVGEYFGNYDMQADRNRIRDKYLEEGHAFVEVTAAPTAGEAGAAVTFTVREGPRVHVSDIVFHGLKQISESKIAKNMETRERTFWNFLSPPEYRAQKLESDIRVVMNNAWLEGYLDARAFVRELVWDADKENVDIHIQVEEGLRYTIESVEVAGNKVFATEELRKLLRALPGQPAALRALDGDQKRLESKYRNAAYIDMRVDEDLRVVDVANAKVALTWRILEGEKVYVGRIDFFGNSRTREKVLRREMRLIPGEEFDFHRLEQSVDRIRALRYFENQGPEMYFRAWAPLRAPDVVVEVIPGATPEVRDLVIHVQEGRTGNIKVGGSFNDNFGFSGLIELTQNNFDISDLPKSAVELLTGQGFSGAGQFFSLVAQPGYRRSRYEVTFAEPWFFDYPVAFDVSASRADQDLRLYRERRTGGSVGFSRRWDDADLRTETFDLGLLSGVTHLPLWFLVDDLLIQGNSFHRFWERGLTLGISYRLARIDISDIDDDAPSDAFDVEGLSYLSSISVKVAIDRRDSRVFPSRGLVSTVIAEYAGYPIGGYYDFWKLRFFNETFTTLYTTRTGGKWIFRTELQAGFAQEHYYSEELPIFERFFAGGTGSFRGFEFRTISPKENDEPIGGNIMTLATAEVHWPLFRIDAFGRDTDILRMALFTDWGTVVANTHDFGRFRWSVGFGFRLQIPLGPQIIPVSIDFGYPLRKQDDDEGQTVHIGFDFGF